MFLFLMTFGLVLLYVLLYFGLSIFFSQRVPSHKNLSSVSMLTVGVLSLAVVVITFLIPNEWWGNRFEHSVGGGVVASLAFFLAVRDSRLVIHWLQYVVLSVLIVTFMGVVNELAELAGQTLYPSTLVFSKTIDDTWLDLLSNAVGSMSAFVFVVFTAKTNRS